MDNERRGCAEEGCAEEGTFLVRHPDAPELYAANWLCRAHALAQCKPGVHEMRWVSVDGVVREEVLEARTLIVPGAWYAPQHGTLTERHHVFTDERDALVAAEVYFDHEVRHIDAIMRSIVARRNAIRLRFNELAAEAADGGTAD